MSNSKWTDEQLTAICSNGCNLLVSAAAGAGKTAVLVERIIRKITDEQEPVDVDRLLVVTFTRAAAAEMKERISAAIAAELCRNPASGHLRRQMNLLHKASITTLHSFCLDLLRRYFYRLNLDPAFRVADDTETALLRQETLDELFEEQYGSGDLNFLALVDAYGGDRDDTALQDMVLRLYDFATSHPWPDRWLTAVTDMYRVEEGTPLEALPWGQTILSWLELRFQECRARLMKATALAAAPFGPAGYLDALAADMALLDELIRALDISWQALYAAFAGAEFPKLSPCRREDVDESLKAEAQKERDEVKKIVRNIKDSLFARPPEDLAADLGRVAPYVRTLTGLVNEFADRYREAKKLRAIVDFADLEHYCLQILADESSIPGKIVPSGVALELREHFAEVLVDEYQDINGVQETILELVSRDAADLPNRFMVGDVKQSIYRFRLADPGLFMKKYEAYPREAGTAERAVDLTRNFRSRPEIIDAVNFIFRQIMTRQVGEITYDQKAELRSGCSVLPAAGNAGAPAEPVELYIVEKPQQGTPDRNGGSENDAGMADEDEPYGSEPEGEDLDAVQREARLVAGRINRMVFGTADRPGPEILIRDKKTGACRPVQYRDIVILLRTTRNQSRVFLEELRLAGIPAYADMDTGYFEAIEVETVLSLLRVIDNPRQDIPLAAVLRSPIVGLTAGDLAQVRSKDTTGDFYEAVCRAAGSNEGSAGAKLQRFLEKLEEWRTLARRAPLSELIWRIYNETGYYAYVGGMPGGAQRQANLRALHDRACQYESTAFRGLFRFLRFVEKLREGGNDLGTAPAVGENEDVVRILSIHRSKGLEFPIVIVAGLGKQFNTRDLKQKALFHRELGLGLPVVDQELQITYPTIACTAIARRLYMEMLAEEMRILYVAMTRAREKLVLVGSVQDLAGKAAAWCASASLPDRTLPDYLLASAKCCLDWIAPAVARHPDGNEIRKLAGCSHDPAGHPATDCAGWRVVPVTSGSGWPGTAGCLDSRQVLPEAVRKLAPVETPGTFADTVDCRLSWKYPFAAVAGKPAKVTVTEIKRRFAAESADDFTGVSSSGGMVREGRPLMEVRPVFLQRTTGLSAAEYGSAMHLVMQHLDFRKAVSEKDIQKQIEEMAAAELLTPEQAEAVDVRAVRDFVSSRLGQRIADSLSVYREVPFTMAVPAALVYDPADSESAQLENERVLVQGVIDVMIDEGDGYVLIDYKTDRLGTGEAGEAAHRYRGQLNLYAMAVEKILHKPVKEKYLYLFSLGQEIKCD